MPTVQRQAVQAELSRASGLCRNTILALNLVGQSPQPTGMPLWHESGMIIIESILRAEPSRAMRRLLLLVAIVLVLPLAARAEVRANRGLEACPVVSLWAAPLGGSRLRMSCCGFIAKVCGAHVASCSANCAQDTVLLPDTLLPASIASPLIVLAGHSELQDHHGPPDPLPPRPIAIS